MDDALRPRNRYSLQFGTSLSFYEYFYCSIKKHKGICIGNYIIQITLFKHARAEALLLQLYLGRSGRILCLSGYFWVPCTCSSVLRLWMKTIRSIRKPHPQEKVLDPRGVDHSRRELTASTACFLRVNSFSQSRNISTSTSLPSLGYLFYSYRSSTPSLPINSKGRGYGGKVKLIKRWSPRVWMEGFGVHRCYCTL